jgi:uroporphyrinogen-III synthase
MEPVIIVTRPAAAGERLHRKLVSLGWNAVWCPAFDIAPPDDVGRAREVLARLEHFDLAVFVSPIAVEAAARLLDRPWPAGVAIGAVGTATAAAAAAALAPPEETPIIAPPADVGSGSEAFWAAWTRSERGAKRVLVLRAQRGREWLVDRFVAAGSAVETLPVYTRADRDVDGATLETLRRSVSEGRPVLALFTSTEAIDALDRQLGREAGVLSWLRSGLAVASHVRIREHLLASGYTRVELTTPDDEAQVARLESLQRSGDARS